MTHEHGYSVRRLAQKLGKDKGYIENRLRLAGAPTEIKQLVSLRKDTLSHAYELLKVEDPKKRRRLAEQVASGELSLVKLREKIEGRPRVERVANDDEGDEVAAVEEVAEVVEPAPRHRDGPLGDDALIDVKASLNEALDQLADVFEAPQVLADMRESDRQNLAKYLTISKLRLENAIIKVRNGH
jgi:ParB-like chromosome segregation protein Spo0J